MQQFEVGKVWGEAKGHADGTKFDIDDSGAIMIVYFNSPTPNEVSAFAPGEPFEIRFTSLTDVIMITAKIGDLNWMDFPYTPHLSKNLTRLTFPGENQGLALTLMLVDTATGIVKSLRMMGLSESFTRKLYGNIMELQAMPFDSSVYAVSVNNILAKYSTKQIVSMSTAYCKIR